jgi:hypothetical protein
VLPQLRLYDTTDPRDKIYAILSAVIDGQHENLLVDYTLSVAEVYENFAAHFITRDAALEILKYCQLDHRVSGLPSWGTGLDQK